MTDVANHISDLLLTHNCVIVPGLGGFVTNYQAAKIHAASHIFNGPTKSVAFNVNLSANDGLLVNKIVSGEYMNLFDAEKCVAQFVREIKSEINGGGIYKLPKIGRLMLDKEGNMQFVPDPSNNFLLQNYGLPAFEAKPVTHSRESVRQSLEAKEIPVGPAVGKRLGRQFKIIALSAAAVLAVTLALQLFIQVNVKGNNYADILGLEGLFHSEIVASKQYTPRPLRMHAYFLKYYRPTTALTDSIPLLQADALANTSQEIEPPVEQQSATPGKYWVIAGAFDRAEQAEVVKDKIYQQGFSSEIIERNDYFMVAVSIPAEMPYASFRLQFIETTGITDAWVLRK